MSEHGGFLSFYFFIYIFWFSHFVLMCEFGAYPRLLTPSSRVEIISMFVDFWYWHGLPIWFDHIIHFYIMDVKWDLFCRHFIVCIYELSQLDWCAILHYFFKADTYSDPVQRAMLYKLLGSYKLLHWTIVVWFIDLDSFVILFYFHFWHTNTVV